MPLAYYFHLSRPEQNDYFRFGALFVTFPKSQTIMFTILLLLTKSAHNYLGVKLGDFTEKGIKFVLILIVFNFY